MKQKNYSIFRMEIYKIWDFSKKKQPSSYLVFDFTTRDKIAKLFTNQKWINRN